MEEAKKTYKMKWFKCIIYVQLFFNTLAMSIQGVQYITGTIYGETKDLVYAFWGQTLRTCDILFGVVNFVLAVAAIVVRMRLAKFKKDGPLCYLVFWGAQGLVSAVYTLATYAIIGEAVGTSIYTIIGVIVGTAVAVIVNYDYFNKRKELFVN